jgi:N-acetylgalactosamine-6-sulfatase
LFLSTLAGTLAPAQTTRKPNIVFILADDMGWGDLSCYGNRGLKTPGIDRLAQEGMLFTQFYVCGPVCSPSRTAFTTGHFPARHRVHGHFATEELNTNRGMPHFLDPSVPTLARQLKKAGYTTVHYGKWHLGHNGNAPMPDAYGFDEHKSVTSMETRWQEQAAGFRARSSAQFVDWGIEFAEKNRDRPFYMQLWMLLPHATLDPTPEQLKPFAGQGPGNGTKHLGANQIYNASVHDLDSQVGRLLKKLDELGLAENTIVVYSSDNGPEDIHIRNASHSAYGSPGPFRGRKRSLYEGGVRVPFLVRWPARVPRGKVNDKTVVAAVDFLPTLLEIAGVAPEGAVDGESMADVFAGKARARVKPVHWEWRFNIAGYYANKSPMLSIRDGDWKLLFNPDRSRVELYDIPRDPYENTNLAAANPDVVKALMEKALAWQKTLPAGPVDPGAGSLAYPMPKGNL